MYIKSSFQFGRYNKQRLSPSSIRHKLNLINAVAEDKPLYAAHILFELSRATFRTAVKALDVYYPFRTSFIHKLLAQEDFPTSKPVPTVKRVVKIVSVRVSAKVSESLGVMEKQLNNQSCSRDQIEPSSEKLHVQVEAADLTVIKECASIAGKSEQYSECSSPKTHNINNKIDENDQVVHYDESDQIVILNAQSDVTMEEWERLIPAQRRMFDNRGRFVGSYDNEPVFNYDYNEFNSEDMYVESIFIHTAERNHASRRTRKRKHSQSS